jgi:hypothetical protein
MTLQISDIISAKLFIILLKKCFSKLINERISSYFMVIKRSVLRLNLQRIVKLFLVLSIRYMFLVESLISFV